MVINLIEQSELYQFATLDANIDPSWVYPFVEIAQLIHLKSLLGRELYNELILQYGSNTLTPEMAGLHLLTKPYLAFLATYEALPAFHYRLTNKGVQTLTDSYSQSGGEKEISYIRSQWYNQSQAYRRLIDEYISDNADYFSTWLPCNNTSNTYNLGIYFPEDNGCCFGDI